METPSMRPSKVLAKLRNGEVANSIKINLADPRAVEIAGICGADSVWLDVEHCTNSITDIENQVRAAKAYGIDSIVRVERGSYSDLIRPLELDATGIMAPHVMSGEDAKDIAWRTRFHPIGRRPMDGGNSDGAYCTIPTVDYIEQANRERMVIVQIEDPEAMAEVDAIAQVDGIDMILFGPGDYSHAIGAPGQGDHPEVIKGYERVAEAALAHGKFAGTVSPIDGLKWRYDLGYRFIACGADVLAMTENFSKVVDAYKELG